MKSLRSAISILTVSMMCFTLSGAVYAQALDQQPDAFEKISEELLQKYGLTSSSYSNHSIKQKAESSSKELPVMIWCTQDIDHDVAEQKALPKLTETMKTASTFSAFSISSVEDVLANAESLSDEAIQEFIESERAESRKMYQKLNGQFVEKYMPDEDILYISEYSPVVFANLTLNEVLNLAESPDTLEFSYAGIDNEIKDDMGVSIPSTKTNLVHEQYQYTGKGIKIGQIENAVPLASDSQLSGANVHFHNTIIPYRTIPHATWVADILVGQKTDEYVSGVAPDAELYCTCRQDFGNTDVNLSGQINAVEWLLSQGVNVINCSAAFGDDGEDTTPTRYNLYYSSSKWLDHIACQHYVTFVKSSGNHGEKGVNSGGMAYNIITVGNIDDKNTLQISDDTIFHESSFYSADTGLAYKPDLCAPGTNIVNSAFPNGNTGTSASTPHVAGAVALLMQAKPALKLQPATIKAILTASVGSQTTKRFCPSDWSGDTNNAKYNKYTKYGAGLLDTKKSIDTAKMGHYYSSKLTSTKSAEEFTINITSAQSTVRVSLAFLKNVTSPYDEHIYVGGILSNPLADLDLEAYDSNGNLMDFSYTSNNNVEIVEFTAPKAGTYKIKIYNASSALTEDITYGLSWDEWTH